MMLFGEARLEEEVDSASASKDPFSVVSWRFFEHVEDLRT